MPIYGNRDRTQPVIPPNSTGPLPAPSPDIIPPLGTGRDPLAEGPWRYGRATAERELRVRDDRHRDMMALLAPAAASFVAYARPGASSPSARDAWHMIRNASLLLDALDAWERGDDEPDEPSETAPEAAG